MNLYILLFLNIAAVCIVWWLLKREIGTVSRQVKGLHYNLFSWPKVRISHTHVVSIPEALSIILDEVIRPRNEQAEQYLLSHHHVAWEKCNELLLQIDFDREWHREQAMGTSVEAFKESLRKALRKIQAETCFRKRRHDEPVEGDNGREPGLESYPSILNDYKSLVSDKLVDQIVEQEVYIFESWRKGCDDRPKWRQTLRPFTYSAEYIEFAVVNWCRANRVSRLTGKENTSEEVARTVNWQVDEMFELLYAEQTHTREEFELLTKYDIMVHWERSSPKALREKCEEVRRRVLKALAGGREEEKENPTEKTVPTETPPA